MKNRRFLSLFFCLVLIFTLGSSALAAEGDTGDWEVAAKAALLADPDTGEILYARNIHERLYPASLTKVMTALLVLEAVDSGKLSMDTVLTASQTAIDNLPSDGSNAGIKVGEEMTVENLLYCILVVSANEACDILAEGVAGSIDAFVEQMNARAKAIGCENTHFANTNGLQDSNHYTTAWDLYLITQEAMKHEMFMPICNNKVIEIPATNLSPSRTYYTTNYLLSPMRNDNYVYQGAEGVKTGSTSDAGYCLIATATRNGRSLLSVVLGAKQVTLDNGDKDVQSFSETIKLLDWGFDEFTRQVILGTDELIDEVPVALSQEQNSVKVHPAEEIECLISNDIDPEKDITRTVTFTEESVEAPVTKGQVLGEITLSCGDTVYGTVDLLADEDVSASRLLVFRRDLVLFFQKPVVKIAIAAVVALIILIIVLRLTVFNRRRRYGRGYTGPRSGGYRGRRR